MAADTVKCPHCFGDKPAAAKVCLHCGRDEQGFGPMVCASQAVIASDSKAIRRRGIGSDLKIHMLVAVLAATLGFLIMLSSGLGSLLFIFGVALLLITRVRMWWRDRLRG